MRKPRGAPPSRRTQHWGWHQNDDGAFTLISMCTRCQRQGTETTDRRSSASMTEYGRPFGASTQSNDHRDPDAVAWEVKVAKSRRRRVNTAWNRPDHSARYERTARRGERTLRGPLEPCDTRMRRTVRYRRRIYNIPTVCLPGPRQTAQVCSTVRKLGHEFLDGRDFEQWWMQPSRCIVKWRRRNLRIGQHASIVAMGVRRLPSRPFAGIYRAVIRSCGGGTDAVPR